MAMQQIPLTNQPNQQLSVSLTVDGKPLTLQLQLRFNEMASYWVLSISDRFGNLLRDSIPMLTGGWPAGNLLKQCAYLGIGSAYVVKIGSTTADYPGSSDWETNFRLVWGDTAK